MIRTNISALAWREFFRRHLVHSMLALVTVVAASGLVRVAAAGPLFTPPFPGYATGINPFFVAMGDLNGDGKADLVAIWQEGSSQQVRVFLGRDGGFEPDPVWTDRLQTGLGSETVTALAVGDVDADGCADVVLGRGLELAVLQNKPDGFVKVWSHMINPPLVTKITAVAVGRLAGSDPNQSLDIVTASNTPYDNSMTPVSTLYLHAFRPQ